MGVKESGGTKKIWSSGRGVKIVAASTDFGRPRKFLAGNWSSGGLLEISIQWRDSILQPIRRKRIDGRKKLIQCGIFRIPVAVEFVNMVGLLGLIKLKYINRPRSRVSREI
jgi:hypothetical protein